MEDKRRFGVLESGDYFLDVKVYGTQTTPFDFSYERTAISTKCSEGKNSKGSLGLGRENTEEKRIEGRKKDE